MKANVDSKVAEAIIKYQSLVQSLLNKHYADMGYTFEAPPTVTLDWGKRYVRVVKNGSNSRSVHSFIDTRNGDILKAAGWKAPAPNGVRGSILSDDIGASVINEHGTNYLR